MASAVVEEMEVGSLREAVGKLPEPHRHVLARRYGLGVRNIQREAEWALRTGMTRQARRSA